MQPNPDFLDQWGRIVNDVEKDHVPIECVKKVIFRHNDRRQKTLNLTNLRRQNLVSDEISAIVERYIQENEDEINSMEFVLDVEAVVIGGGLGVRFADTLVPQIIDGMGAYLLDPENPPTVRVAALGDNGGVIGASLLVS